MGLGIFKRKHKVVAKAKPLYEPTSSHHPERLSESEHSHTCPACKTRWFHGPENAFVPAAHDCPKPGCTGHQGWKDNHV